jgi:hypothetical protein
VSIGIADSSYVRFIIAYGILLSLVIFWGLIVKLITIIKIHTYNKMFLSLVLVYGVASVSMDLTFMFTICVPIYVLTGYEYSKIKNRNRLEKL